MPNDVAAIRMLAELSARLGRDDEALELLTRCLELASGSTPRARTRRRCSIAATGRPRRCRKSKRCSRRNQPTELPEPQGGDPRSHRRLRAGDRVVRGSVGHASTAASAVVDELRATRSRPRDSRTARSPPIAAPSASIRAAARRTGAWPTLKTVRFDADDIAAMQRQLQRNDLDDEPRLHFDFALGKALEDAGEYEPSFRHYLDGNALRLKLVPYSADDNAARGRAARRVYTREFFAEREGWGAMRRIRSSSSACRARQHPGRADPVQPPGSQGTMELPEIISCARPAPARGVAAGHVLPRHPRRHRRRRSTRARRAVPAAHAHPPQARRAAVHRQDAGTTAHIGLIRLALPNAKIIDARRHPLACCLSGFKQHFARGQDFSYSPRRHRPLPPRLCRTDGALRRGVAGRVHRVIYEDMVADTEAEVRRLLAYCGSAVRQACLRFYENPRAVRTAEFRAGAPADLPRWRRSLAPLRGVARTAEAGARAGARCLSASAASTGDLIDPRRGGRGNGEHKQEYATTCAIGAGAIAAGDQASTSRSARWPGRRTPRPAAARRHRTGYETGAGKTLETSP